MIRSFRNGFLTGIALLLPLGVTLFFVKVLLDNVGYPLSRLFFWFIDAEMRQSQGFQYLLNFISILFVAVVVTGFGFFSKYFLGRFLMSVAERLITSVPFVNSVYNTVKQVVETISQQKDSVFRKVVLVEFPRQGSYAVGFETSRAKGEVQFKTEQEVVNVFIPTTPNPTSGFLVMVPADAVIQLDMTVGDGMKLIISGGAVVPKYSPAESSGLMSDKIPATEHENLVKTK